MTTDQTASLSTSGLNSLTTSQMVMIETTEIAAMTTAPPKASSRWPFGPGGAPRQSARLARWQAADVSLQTRPIQPGCTPNSQAAALKLPKASTVLVMMMRAMRPLSAP
jgi:hypothetical protein